MLVNFLTLKSKSATTRTTKLQYSEGFPALINSTLGTLNVLFATLWTARDFTTFSYVFITLLFFSSTFVKFTSLSYCFPIITLNLISFRFHSFSSCVLTFHISSWFSASTARSTCSFQVGLLLCLCREKKNHIIRWKSASERKKNCLENVFIFYALARCALLAVSFRRWAKRRRKRFSVVSHNSLAKARDSAFDMRVFFSRAANFSRWWSCSSRRSWNLWILRRFYFNYFDLKQTFEYLKCSNKLCLKMWFLSVLVNHLNQWKVTQLLSYFILKFSKMFYVALFLH